MFIEMDVCGNKDQSLSSVLEIRKSMNRNKSNQLFILMVQVMTVGALI